MWFEGQYVHVCVRAHAHVLGGGGQVFAEARIWRWLFSQLSLFWSFETEPLSEPEAHQFKQAG